MTYTIKKIADLAGVTTRTLRYYDEIGLLSPADTGENRYRYYDQSSLLRLQQILFFRELDVPLKEIQLIMTRPDFNLAQALDNHRLSLKNKANRLDKLIGTIDQTISTIKGGKKMSAEDYFEGFDESRYEEETRQRWGNTRHYVESQKRWAGYSKKQKEAIKAEGSRLTTRMAGSNPEATPDDPDVQAAIGEYHAYINKYFYTCDVGFLRGLADMWVEDPRFAVNFERIRQGGAEFVRQAVTIYCDQTEKA
jgi:DNA-binding transcriptional MerR regulator